MRYLDKLGENLLVVIVMNHRKYGLLTPVITWCLICEAVQYSLA